MTRSLVGAAVVGSEAEAAFTAEACEPEAFTEVALCTRAVSTAAATVVACVHHTPSLAGRGVPDIQSLAGPVVPVVRVIRSLAAPVEEIIHIADTDTVRRR